MNIGKALALKEEGNKHFKEGKYQQAIAAYHQVCLQARRHCACPVRYHICPSCVQIFMYVHGYSESSGGGGGGGAGMPGQTTKPVTPEEMAQIKELKVAHFCNLAMCHMRFGPKYVKARDNCTKALAIDADNVKGAPGCHGQSRHRAGDATALANTGLANISQTPSILTHPIPVLPLPLACSLVPAWQVLRTARRARRIQGRSRARPCASAGQQGGRARAAIAQGRL